MKYFSFPQYGIPGTVRASLWAALIVSLVVLSPRLVLAQTAAAVSLDNSGNLVLSATLEYDNPLTLEIFENFLDEGYWGAEIDTAVAVHWVYYDLRNSNYDNGKNNAVTSPSNLISLFNTTPLSPSLGSANSDFLQDLFYLGEYTFGDTDYDYTPPMNLPDIELLGNNAYYAGKAGARAIGVIPSQNIDDTGTLSLRLVLPFDATTDPSLSPVEFHLKGDSGSIISELGVGFGHAPHEGEYGRHTGSWIASPTGCSAGDTINDCGLIGGNYEFVVYIETHSQTGPQAISAFQDEIPYVRFTIVDEDSSAAPPVTIYESTSYVGEADLVTGSTFAISNDSLQNPHVDFIVGNGHGITLAANFSAEFGTSFKTILGGGTALSKGGSQQRLVEETTPVPQIGGAPQPGRVTVYPNPSSGVIWADVSADSRQLFSFSVHDVLGRAIGSEVKVEVLEGLTRVNLSNYIDLSFMVNGTYVLRVRYPERVESIPFMILR